MLKITPNTPLNNIPDGVIFWWPENEGKNYIPEKDDIIIGNNVKFRPPCVIYWGCRIGDNSQISHNSNIREYTEIGARSVIGRGVYTEGYSKIGNFVTIETQCHITGKMVIEDNVFMGPNCTTTNTKTIVHGRENLKLIEKGPLIKFGARIGGGVTICPDLVIGREALIGAGAVVTKDIPDFKIAVGIPAKVIGEVPKNERY